MVLLTLWSESFICYSTIDPNSLFERSASSYALSLSLSLSVSVSVPRLSVSVSGTLTLWARRTQLRTTSWRLTLRSASLASSPWFGEKRWPRRQSQTSCSCSFTCQSSTRPSGSPPATTAVRFLLAPCASVYFQSSLQPAAVEYQFRIAKVPRNLI